MRAIIGCSWPKGRREFVAGLTSTAVGLLIVVALAACLCVPSPWSVAYSWAQGIAPRYEVDVTFPQPFPDLWVTGGFGGHCIDAQDHVLLLNRQDVLDGELNSGHLAPLMIELDPTGRRSIHGAIPISSKARSLACAMVRSNSGCTPAISTRTTMSGSQARRAA